jgi:hypothetical protein
MTYLNGEGYIERKTRGGSGNRSHRPSRRDWYLVKFASNGLAYVDLNRVYLPNHLAGKRIRFKVGILARKEGQDE